MTKNTKTVAKALGDTELVLLASGGKHPDHLIEIPDTMKPGTRQRAAANLVKRGLAEERGAGPADPVWRESEDGRFTLAITAAGLAAIGIEEGTTDASNPSARRVARPDDRTEASHPREGSKGALLVSLLSRTSGASIDELTAATGWLPHTTRAALTGLRKRGFAIDREPVDGGGSRYCIPVAEAKATTRRSRKQADLQAA